MSGSNATMYRGGMELRKQRLIAPERIGFVGIAILSQTAALKQSYDPAGNIDP